MDHPKSEKEVLKVISMNNSIVSSHRKDTRTESLVTLDFMLESKTEESH